MISRASFQLEKHSFLVLVGICYGESVTGEYTRQGFLVVLEDILATKLPKIPFLQGLASDISATILNVGMYKGGRASKRCVIRW
jgi:hypothetical protein